jgi:hypothetical protein
MSRFAIGCAAGAALMLGQANQTQAAFASLDDFQSFSVGQGINGVNGWAVKPQTPSATVTGDRENLVASDPTSPANRVLDVKVTSTTASPENNIKAASVAEGNVGTLFFRFYVPQGATPDLSIGLSGIVEPREGTDIASTFRINGAGLEAYDGSAFKSIGSVSTDTWYNVWMVVNNPAGSSSDKFEVYIEGGAYATQTKLAAAGPDDEFAFRPRATAPTNPADLVSFVIRANNAHVSDDSTLFDDIYIDSSSANLVNPIPEPTSLALLAMGGAALVRRRRV